MAREKSPWPVPLPSWPQHMNSWSEHTKLPVGPWSHHTIMGASDLLPGRSFSLPTWLISNHPTWAILYHLLKETVLTNSLIWLYGARLCSHRRQVLLLKASSHCIITNLISEPQHPCSNYILMNLLMPSLASWCTYLAQYLAKNRPQ